MFLSVITPSYNRAHTLKRCYNSLVAQTDNDFEWIVVDDGSIDGTKELVDSFIKENKIHIKYFYKENGGKPSAHNLGVEKASGKLCVCVDSDDALTSDAVEKVRLVWANSKNNNVGILAKRGDYVERKPICADLPIGVADCKMIELQQRYKFFGDTALFFRTSVLKEHHFKIFSGEKFVPEDALYSQIDKIGTMILYDRVLYLCEYLQDGLTAGYKQLLINNPMGTAYCYYCRIDVSNGLKNKLKNAIISEAYLKLAGRKAEYNKDKHRFILAFAKLFSNVYRRKKIGE